MAQTDLNTLSDRTGNLILPELSSAEGITLLILVQFALMIFGDPEWLLFNIAAMNVATVILLLVLGGYAVAVVMPTWRVWKHNRKIGELVPAVLIASGACAFVAAGASAEPARALRPVHDRKPGHPVYLPRACFAKLAELRGDEGARSLLPALDPFPLECADSGVILDIDRSDQIAHMESLLSRESEHDAF